MDPADLAIRWNERLSIGIAEIDADHQRFILLVNDLLWAISARLAKPKIEHRLRLVIRDAKTHFTHEELLFAEHGYPDANHHAELHAELMDQLLRVLDDFNRSEDYYHSIEYGSIIKQLLLNHLLDEDMKYREFLVSRMNRFGAERSGSKIQRRA